MPKINGKEIMDETCMRIFLYLITHKRELRFNELHNKMNNLGDSISKPTLSDHLKHLAAKKIIIRKVIDAQNVTYKINYKKFEKFEGFLDRVYEKSKEIENNKKTLASLPIEEQVKEVLRLNSIRKLEELKLMVSHRLYHKEEDGLLLIGLQSDYYKLPEIWLVENCLTSDELKSRAFNEINELINTIDPENKKRDKID